MIIFSITRNIIITIVFYFARDLQKNVGQVTE